MFFALIGADTNEARPGYGFLGEERGMIEASDKTHTWIVDPLDGTTNFLHRDPQPTRPASVGCACAVWLAASLVGCALAKPPY